MTTVRAVVFDQVGAEPYVTERPDPVCPPDGVLLDVEATGVCRSDWHAWRGHEPVPLPHVGGHELAGRVATVGPAVTGFAVGERVTVPFVCGCGRCEVCRGGDPQVCPDQTQPGFTHDGSFAERVAIFAADANLVRLPDGLDPVAAAALGCRFATAYGALVGHGRVSAGRLVLVLGCGGVGLSAVQLAVALGATVVAVDVVAVARERALALGAAFAVDPVDVPALVADLGGAHLSLDALGSPALVDLGVRSLRRRGRHVQVGLLLGADAAPPVPMDLVVARELELYGSHGLAAAAYPALLELVTSDRVDPAALVGRVITLDEIPLALTAMDHPPTHPGLVVARL